MTTKSSIKITNIEPESQIVIQNSNINAQFCNEVIYEAVTSKTQTERVICVKRKRVVGSSGACFMSQQSREFLKLECEAKRQKVVEKERRDKEKEFKKKKNEQKEKDKEKNKKIEALIKYNRSRKTCSCGKKMSEDKINKKSWLDYFECGSWCCGECLPIAYQGNLRKVFICFDCAREH